MQDAFEKILKIGKVSETKSSWWKHAKFVETYNYILKWTGRMLQIISKVNHLFSLKVAS